MKKKNDGTGRGQNELCMMVTLDSSVTVRKTPCRYCKSPVYHITTGHKRANVCKCGVVVVFAR